MNPRHLWIAACAAWLAAAPAGATSYVMMADEDLADQAALIAVVRVDRVEPAHGAVAPATDYLVGVERAVKGVSAPSLRIRVPGGTDARGVKRRVFGMPRFAPGERALVFLAPAGDGSYRVAQALLG